MRRLYRKVRCYLFGHTWGGWVPLMRMEGKRGRRATRQCYACREFSYQYAESRDFVSDIADWPQEMVD